MTNVGTKYFKGLPWVFQQYGAPSHTSHFTTAWLSQINILFITPNEWPPSSPRPELARLTSAFRVSWRQKQDRSAIVSEVSLLWASIAAWKEVPQKALRNACESVPRRLCKVISTDAAAAAIPTVGLFVTYGE